MTSELILLFLYFGFIALRNAIDDPRRADRACGAARRIVGVVNMPIIYFSVQWWNTLHQGASVSLTAAPKMAAIMLAGMLLMAFAAWMYAIAVALCACARSSSSASADRAWVDDAARMRVIARDGRFLCTWAATGSTCGARTASPRCDRVEVGGASRRQRSAARARRTAAPSEADGQRHEGHGTRRARVDRRRASPRSASRRRWC